MTDLFLRSTADKGDTLRLRSDADKIPSGATYYLGFRVQGEGDLALTDVGSHPLRVRKGGITYGLELVTTGDPNASRIRVRHGATMAIRKYT